MAHRASEAGKAMTMTCNPLTELIRMIEDARSKRDARPLLGPQVAANHKAWHAARAFAEPPYFWLGAEAEGL